MPALSLPDVTLVAIDCAAHALTRLALEDTMRQIEPAELLVWSDRPITGDYDCVRLPCDNRSVEDAMRVLWYEVPARVRTTHFLHVEWDGWVLDGSRWDPAWLDVDYLGAPWPWHRDLAVGNGGFSLRSTDLTRWVAANPSRYPQRCQLGWPEDDALCRHHRPALERDGFTWGSRAQAEAFSFEREAPRPAFGYHGAWHWASLLDDGRLTERLALANAYVRGKPEWVELMSAIGS